MKIVHLSTWDTNGGAAIAAFRTHKAMLNNGLDSTFLVQTKTGTDSDVVSYTEGFLSKKLAFGRFVWERLTFLPHEVSKNIRFAFSTANTGIDITSHPLFKQADVINLHWTNFGFLSLSSLRKVFESGKPVIWTLYDMWAFTGGCHYSEGCMNFQSHCGNCHFLRNPSPKDLSFSVFEQKIKAFQSDNFTVVGCSNWLTETAQSGALFRNIQTKQIFTPIDSSLFKAKDKAKARTELGLSASKKLVLFGAMNTQDKRKGFQYLAESLDFLKKWKENDEIELVVFGKANEEVLNALPFKVNNLGTINSTEKLINIYSAVDVLVVPSLEDNLPNTITEALSCSTPVVAFDAGGMPEMIDHLQNGFIAKFKSSEDLAKGILTILESDNYQALCTNARLKIEDNFSEKIIAQKYRQLYNSVLNN